MLLQFLVRHAQGAPLLVIATYRDVELDKAHPLSASLRNLLRHGETLPLTGLRFVNGMQAIELSLTAGGGGAAAEQSAHDAGDAHPPAGGHGDSGHHGEPHESPGLMLVPLLILAVMAVIA